jgi:hypothetical protein
MTIYLNNLKHGHLSSSYLKSSDKVTAFYFITAFILLKFYTRMGFYIWSFLYIHRVLSHFCILHLLYAISFILIIFILST